MQQFLDNTTVLSEQSSRPRALEHIFVKQPREHTLEPIDLHSTDDELFLLIDDRHASLAPRRSNYLSDDQDSGVHVEYRQYVLNKKINDNLSARLLKLAETPKRKLRTKTDFDRLRARSLSKADARQHNRGYSSSAFHANLPELQQSSERRDVIRQEVANRMVDMNYLLQYEENLEANLRNRCEKFKAQNERYTLQNGLNTSIDHIQDKLDAYAKDIVSNEFELFKIRLDIKQKCGILHNLRRMLSIENNNEDSTNERCVEKVYSRINKEHLEHLNSKNKTDDNTAVKRYHNDSNEQNVDVTFVDNIYEFCDNNKSIVV